MPSLATLVVLLFTTFLVAEPGAARDNSARHLNDRRRHEAVKRWELSARAPNGTAPAGVKNITFSNPKASRV